MERTRNVELEQLENRGCEVADMDRRPELVDVEPEVLDREPLLLPSLGAAVHE